MSGKKRDVDPIPDEFSSYEEAAEFWDSHDTADYPGAFEDEPIELQADFRKRRFEVEVEEDLVVALRERARRSGISVRQLTSELLRRQLAPNAS